MDSVKVTFSREYRISSELRAQNIMELNRFIFFIHAENDILTSAISALEAFDGAAKIALETSDASLRDQLIGAVEMFRRKMAKLSEGHEQEFHCTLRLFDGTADSLRVPALNPTALLPKESDGFSLTELRAAIADSKLRIGEQLTALEGIKNEIKEVLENAWRPELTEEVSTEKAGEVRRALKARPARAKAINKLDPLRVLKLAVSSDELN